MCETTITVDGATRVVRTEYGGKVRKVAQLEAAHFKAVKAAILEMLIAAAPDTMPYEMAERLAKRATVLPTDNWKRVNRFVPLPRMDPLPQMVEVGPDHYATHEAAYAMG